MTLTITIADVLSPQLTGYMRTLKGPSVRDLHHAMGVEVQNLTFDHVRQLAASRHDAANRLGATPSNHLAQAAEKIASPAALTEDTSGATLTINHPGMIRAMRDVPIVPRNAKALAIPIHALAYNRRPAQLWEQLHLFIPKGKNYIAMSVGKVITPLYILVARVIQKQDRSLLPSDAKFTEAATRGAQNYLRESLRKGANL